MLFVCVCMCRARVVEKKNRMKWRTKFRWFISILPACKTALKWTSQTAHAAKWIHIIWIAIKRAALRAFEIRDNWKRLDSGNLIGMNNTRFHSCRFNFSFGSMEQSILTELELSRLCGEIDAQRFAMNKLWVNHFVFCERNMKNTFRIFA